MRACNAMKKLLSIIYHCHAAAGSKLKATSGWSDDGNGTDDYGSAAGGDRYYDGGSSTIWATTAAGGVLPSTMMCAWYRIMSDYYGNVPRLL